MNTRKTNPPLNFNYFKIICVRLDTLRELTFYFIIFSRRNKERNQRELNCISGSSSETTASWFQQCLQSPAAYQQLAAASAATALAAAASRAADNSTSHIARTDNDNQGNCYLSHRIIDSFPRILG